MTESENRRVLEKYTNNSVRQRLPSRDMNADGRIRHVAGIPQSELRSLCGFAIDEEGMLELRWFASHLLLLEDVVSWLLQRSGSADRRLPNELLNSVQAARGSDEGMEQFEQRMQLLINETYPAFPLAWVGRFATLCTSTEAFPAELRLRFWLATTDEDTTAIITKNLYGDFAMFLDSLTEL